MKMVELKGLRRSGLMALSLSCLTLTPSALAFTPLAFTPLAPQPLNSVAAGALRVPVAAVRGGLRARPSRLGRAQGLGPKMADEFDKGGAEPIGSIQQLDALVPRTEITTLIKQSSDFDGFQQVAWHVGCFAFCAVAYSIFHVMAITPLAWLAMVNKALKP
mmetsp:Transcript_40079/g.62587  ORF Transcript_40079/g.62587 Transcript_40079/m.62587 type:complete len:161 (+) Transcript_40079:27-509(+)